jgi:hypothetical protein
MAIQSKDDCKRGDVLLLWDESKSLKTRDWWTHKGIRLGQSLTSINRLKDDGVSGISTLVHAVIWIKVKNEEGSPEIAEASGSCARLQVRRLQPGRYSVFRSANRVLSALAANLAWDWAHQGNIAYGKNAAVQSVFHSKGYGNKGQDRARMYGDSDFDPREAWNEKIFCSEFVMACYQGAHGQRQDQITGAFAVDARHCSVRALHAQFINNPGQFRFEGILTQD